MATGTKHLIDRELLPVLDQFPAQGEISEASIIALRGPFLQMLGGMAASPLPPGLTRSEIFLPGLGGAPEIRALLYQAGPATALKPAVLHIHGGGYIIGAPEINDAANRQLALALGGVVLSVDYRLAPETRYPGALEDCYAALLFLSQHAAEWGVDRRRIAVLGESAGGGLAAALALYARDKGEVALAYQQLIAPMIDDRTAAARGDEVNRYAGEFIWRPESNVVGWQALLGRDPGGADVPAYAAAARAASVAGLPPTYISVGALDLFVDENVTYAHRLLRAGVPVELHVFPSAMHGFEVGALSGARVSLAANGMAVAALRKALEAAP